MILIREASARYREPVIRADALWSMAAFAVQIAAGGFVAVLIGRTFGPEVKGYASLVSIGPTVTSWLLALGIGHASMFLVAGRGIAAAELLTTATVAAAILGVVAAIAGWIVLAPAAGSADVAFALGLGLSLAFVQLLRDFYVSVLLGLNHVVLYAKAMIVSRLAGVFVVILAVFLLPLPFVYLSIPVSIALANVLVVALVIRRLSWGWRWSTESLSQQLRFGLRSHFGNVSEIGVLRFDQFAVYLLLGPVALGLYSVGALVADLLAQAAQAASYVFFARIAGAGERGRYLARLAVGASVLALFVVATPVFLFADRIVVPVFGIGFEAAVPTLRILAFAAVAQGTARVAVSALRALGSPLQSSAAYAIGLLVTAPLVLWLSRYGIEGVAVGALAGHLVVAVMAYIGIQGPTGRPVGRL